MSKLFDLTECVVLVTGSTGQLGSAMASGLCSAGATVILNSRSAATLAQQAASLREAGGHVDCAHFDVTQPSSRLAALGHIKFRHGRLDALVNNAYATSKGSGKEAFQEAYDIAVTSSWGLIQDALETPCFCGHPQTRRGIRHQHSVDVWRGQP